MLLLAFKLSATADVTYLRLSVIFFLLDSAAQAVTTEIFAWHGKLCRWRHEVSVIAVNGRQQRYTFDHTEMPTGIEMIFDGLRAAPAKFMHIYDISRFPSHRWDYHYHDAQLSWRASRRYCFKLSLAIISLILMPAATIFGQQLFAFFAFAAPTTPRHHAASPGHAV